MSVKTLGVALVKGHFARGLRRVPESVRGLAGIAATLAGIGGALDHIEKQLILAARRICGLRRIVGFMLQAKPALEVDLRFAFGGVTSKMKVQSHATTPPASPASPLFL